MTSIEEQVSILVVEENRDFCELCKEYFTMQGYRFLGVAHDGEDAVSKILELSPNVVLMENFLSKLDGIGVMEKLNSMRVEKDFVMIAMSTVKRDSLIEELFSKGCDYFVMKPFDFKVLDQRILKFVSEKKGYEKRQARNLSLEAFDLEKCVTKMMHEVGIPAHIRGYQYIRQAIIMVVENLDMINSVTKELYPDVAKTYNTSASCVERAIRHAIEVAWARGNTDILNNLFGYTVQVDRGKPSNSEFIAMMADRVRVEYKVS